ncbi:MAG: sigma-70 family RNA polymerase sigma factor [Balneolaceae bacterium]
MDTIKITQLLKAYSSGDRDAFDELMPLVYDNMREMAHYRLLNEHSDHTFKTSDLVHEAYLKLLQFDRIDWEDRMHFFGMASKVMRNILVDYAVRKKAEKRGGNNYRVTLGEEYLGKEINLDDVLSINQALEKLAEIDERQVRVVECRFFGGLTLEDTAKALDISTATVSRDWNLAKAWLNRELTETTKS